MSEVTPSLETTEQSSHNPGEPKVEKVHPDIHHVSGAVRSSFAKRAFLMAFLAGTGLPLALLTLTVDWETKGSGDD